MSSGAPPRSLRMPQPPRIRKTIQRRDGNRLALLHVVRSRLEQRSAEFAFLAASHSAELTDQKICDEMLHPTVAMQYNGFRNVEGTMNLTTRGSLPHI